MTTRLRPRIQSKRNSKKPEDSAQQKISPASTLPQLTRLVQECKACDLWRRATQAVFGEGPANSRVMFVGEVPGDQEDRAGKPFVGPAGQLLDSALAEAGIDRRTVYVTNAVKHFNWVARGKRRIHKKPSGAEIFACRAWLDAEIATVRPQVIVCLGAVAAQALLGHDFRVTQHRGEFVDSPLAPHVTATIHPSAILRAPDEAARHEQMRGFVSDLKKVARVMAKLPR